MKRKKSMKGELKCEGEGSPYRVRLDPADTFLFLIDKDILTHTIFSACLSKELSPAFSLPPSNCLSLCRATMSVGSSVSLGRQREQQINDGHLCMFVCLSGAHPCGLFKPLLER